MNQEKKLNLIEQLSSNYLSQKPETFTVEEYLELCKTDNMAYATAAERMLKAIGEPEVVDTSKDDRLQMLFGNQILRVYPEFKEFHGMEEVIERIVGYFRHSAQGLEERKQILYLLGPVGGGKSSLAEKLKDLMEKYPIYVLSDDRGELSPVLESPLALFSTDKDLLKPIGINNKHIPSILSPWAVKRLKEYEGDISKFRVVKIKPNRLTQTAVVKTEPGDDNNQDIASLVGKTNIRKLDRFDQSDPDSYAFSGALCRANQGIMEFVEMFKAPIKMLHPLLTATQEGNYTGTEALSAIPFTGIVLAHSNESEWSTFKNNKNNEAFLDRVYLVRVPYCLRYSEEVDIYKKMLRDTDLAKTPCVPETLTMLAQFAVMTRLKPVENSPLFSKLQVYNGIDVRETEPNVKMLSEYKRDSIDEGMFGISTRFAFKILSKTFNYDPKETAADPVHMMAVLKQHIKQEQYPKEVETAYFNIIEYDLKRRYIKNIGNKIQQAYIENYDEYGQNLFDRYTTFADHWARDHQFKDPDTDAIYDKDKLHAELQKTELPAGISNYKEFRQEIVNFVLRQERSTGKKVDWKAYEKIRAVIESRIFNNVEELLPIISFTKKADVATQKEHDRFLARMQEMGYTHNQTKRLVEWYIQNYKAIS